MSIDGKKKMKCIYRRLMNFVVAIVWFTMLQNAQAAAVEKEAWVSEMKNVLPAFFCKKDWYFESCFEGDGFNCHKSATIAVDSCLKQFNERFPEIFNQPQDGQRWGNKVGVCAGTLFEAQEVNNKIKSELCNDPANWQ